MIKEEGFCWRCFDKKVPVGWVGEADGGYSESGRMPPSSGGG